MTVTLIIDNTMAKKADDVSSTASFARDGFILEFILNGHSFKEAAASLQISNSAARALFLRAARRANRAIYEAGEEQHLLIKSPPSLKYLQQNKAHFLPAISDIADVTST